MVSLFQTRLSDWVRNIRNGLSDLLIVFLMTTEMSFTIRGTPHVNKFQWFKQIILRPTGFQCILVASVLNIYVYWVTQCTILHPAKPQWSSYLIVLDYNKYLLKWHYHILLEMKIDLGNHWMPFIKRYYSVNTSIMIVLDYNKYHLKRYDNILLEIKIANHWMSFTNDITVLTQES